MVISFFDQKIMFSTESDTEISTTVQGAGKSGRRFHLWLKSD